MDTIDKRILAIIAEDSSISATRLGDLVGLSIPAVNKRLAKLRSEGIIKTSTVITDPKRVGKSVTAFILIAAKYGEGITAFLDYVSGDPDVLECYAVAGEYDYLIKVCAGDVESLENKLLYIKSRKGVLKSYTMLSLMEHKYKATVLPDMDDDKEGDSEQ